MSRKMRQLRIWTSALDRLPQWEQSQIALFIPISSVTRPSQNLTYQAIFVRKWPSRNKCLQWTKTRNQLTMTIIIKKKSQLLSVKFSVLLKNSGARSYHRCWSAKAQMCLFLKMFQVFWIWILCKVSRKASLCAPIVKHHNRENLNTKGPKRD